MRILSPHASDTAVEHAYRLHGLTVRSVFAFPARSAAAGAPCDVTVLKERSRPIPEEAPPGKTLRSAARVTAARSPAGGLVVRYPGMCELSFSADGTRIRCCADPQAAEGVVVEKVVRFGMLAAVVLAGHLVLHASAVAIEGRAVAFAGASKSGKSTLAALACRAGAGLVTDSVLRVDGAGGSCFTGPSELRLRPPADALALDASVRSRRMAPADRVAIDFPQPDADEMSLAAIVLPVLHATAQELEVVRLRGARAVVALTPCLRNWFCQDWELDARHLRELSSVVEHVPVWRCVVPTTPPLDPTYVHEILQRVGGDA